MAVNSIDEVLDRVTDPDLKQLLLKSKEHHEQLGDEIHVLLNQEGTDEKDPNVMAKGMSWMKANIKLAGARPDTEESDAVIADLITDGCNMGIKSLHRYLNQYKAADETSKNICIRLSDIEEELRRDMRNYL